MNIKTVKKAIVTYIYDILNAEYPDYFKPSDYVDDNNTLFKAKNVYWADTMMTRPIDATECYLSVTGSESLNVMGTDGEFYYSEEDDKFYTQTKEDIILTVNIAVSSMKNKALNLTSLQAQNLASDACMYIRNMLKSGSARDYFQYENDIFTPIECLTQKGDMTDIDDVSIFEETRNRFTSQFRCKFKYTEIGSRESKVAYGVKIDSQDGSEDIDIEFNTD